jgi:transketolase
MQVEGRTDSAMPLGNVAAKLSAFGWATEEIDGNDFPSILAAFDRARETKGRPSAIVARTLVGKGAPSLEGIIGHVMKLPPAAADRAMAELEAQAETLR